MSLLSHLFTPPRPLVAVDIASTRVAALRLGAGRPAPIVSYASEPLPAGVVVPSLGTPNIVDPATLAAAVTRAVDAVGRARHVALVVPDSAAKVSLVRFEQAPPRGRDLEAMLRWQVRKSVPFRVEDAQITWADGQALDGGGREFVVALARRDVIAQYEAALATADAHAGVVDLASFNLVNLLLASGDQRQDWLLVHLAPDFVTLIIVRGGRLIFYRHRGSEGEESLADLVHQTAMYYEDRLSGRGFGRVILAGATQGSDGVAGAERARQALEDRLRVRVEAAGFGDVAAFGDRTPQRALLVDDLAPMVGVLAREPAA
jgi:type IV pilus assembly protein PilM